MKSTLVLMLVAVCAVVAEESGNMDQPRNDIKEVSKVIPTCGKGLENEGNPQESAASSPKIFNQIPGLGSKPSTNSSQLPGGISDFFEQIASAVGSFTGGVQPTVEPAAGVTTPTENVTSSSKTLLDESSPTPSTDLPTGTVKGMDTTTPEDGTSSSEGGSVFGAAISTLGPALVAAIPNIPPIPEIPKPPTSDS